MDFGRKLLFFTLGLILRSNIIIYTCSTLIKTSSKILGISSRAVDLDCGVLKLKFRGSSMLSFMLRTVARDT